MTKETLIKLLEKLPANTHVWAFDGDGDIADIRGLGIDGDDGVDIITFTENSTAYNAIIVPDELPDIDEDRVW